MERVTNENFASYNKGGIVQLMSGNMIFPEDKEIAQLLHIIIVKLYAKDQRIQELEEMLKKYE